MVKSLAQEQGGVMKRKMPKAVKETLEAMAKEHRCPPPILKTEVRDVIIYKRFNLYAVLAAMVVMTGCFAVISRSDQLVRENDLLEKTIQIEERAPTLRMSVPQKLVDCTQFVPEEWDWKRKCQSAWRVLRDNPHAGREAFHILDE